MNQSEQINELAKALSNMQGNVGAVFKNKTAKIPTKSGSTYSYSYADLAGIWDCIRKPLMENGLALTQTFNDSMLVTLLMHSSGQWLKSSLPLSCMGAKPQDLGSEITYLRRYALTSILGISADDDDDGAIAQQAEPKVNQQPVISSANASELQGYLDSCSPTYQKQFWNFLRSEVKGIDKIEQLPINMYIRIKNALLKKQDEYAKELAGEFANV